MGLITMCSKFPGVILGEIIGGWSVNRSMQSTKLQPKIPHKSATNSPIQTFAQQEDEKLTDFLKNIIWITKKDVQMKIMIFFASDEIWQIFNASQTLIIKSIRQKKLSHLCDLRLSGLKFDLGNFEIFN
jgi:hypothetical protein